MAAQDTVSHGEMMGYYYIYSGLALGSILLAGTVVYNMFGLVNVIK